MKRVFARLLFALAASFATALHAANTAVDPQEAPFTAKELQQGFRERVILARPHEAQTAAAEAVESRHGARLRERFARFRGLRVLELDGAENVEVAVQRLRASGRYEFVEPDYIRQLAVDPNDPQFASGGLWALRNNGQSLGVAGADIKATQAWDIVREAPNVVVAVIDTGLNLQHQDIVGNLWQNPSPTFGDVNGARFINGRQTGDPTDDVGHGTHVAGTIGAMGNNGVGIAGVAWRVQIMPIKALTASGGAVSDIARAVNYAIERGAHIINASYGAIGTNGFSNTELAAIAAARNAGVIFVAAAGNESANMDVSRFYPASHGLDNIVTVGNSNRRDEVAPSSNYGAAVDLFAPGSDIVSLNYANNTGTTILSGTSMAAPHVSGALALLKAQFPNDSYRQLINRLLRGADRGERFAGRAQTGARLNLLGALTTTNTAPFNDEFSSRARLTGENVALRSNNVGATPEPGEPSHAGTPPSATLWWEWTPPATSRVSIDTAGSGIDTVLAVYTGGSPSALTLVTANDDDPGKTTSRVSFTAQAGTSYQIAVDGKNGVTGLVLVNVGTTPLNDAFASPVALTGESTLVTASNARCTLESGEPRIAGFAGGTSLWYRWTAPRSGRFQVSVSSRDFDPLVAVYTGGELTALALASAAANTSANLRENSALWTLEAVAGTTYMIQVDAKDPRTAGQFTLSLTDSRWQFATGEAITAAPAVATDGTVYFGSIDRSIYALTRDGELKWSFATGGTIDTASPTIAEDGTIYAGSNDGTLYALRPDGTLRWSRAFGVGNSMSNSPALAADGTIYIKGGDGYLYALAPGDGSTRWRVNLNARTTYASPSVATDGTIYQGSDDGRIYALAPDGAVKWTFQSDSDIYTVPAIDRAGNIYFAALNSGKFYSVSPGGALRWTYSGASIGCSSSPALSAEGDTVYFGGYDKKLHAVNTATGAARWVYTLADEVRASSPAVDRNGVIYIGCYDSRLYAINPDGTFRRAYHAGHWLRSSPTLSGHRLYIGSNDKKLYAFDLESGEGAGPWPQYRQNAARSGRASSRNPVAILTPPRAQTLATGGTLALSVTAIGDAPITYQWVKDGAWIIGATHSTYTVANASPSASGAYSVIVNNPHSVGNAGTFPVEVIVTGVKPAAGVENRLLNLSARATAGSGAQTLIVGFYTRGGPVLVRGVGPTLAAFGVAAPLADPQLSVYSAAASLVANNDNWGGTAQLRDAMNALGAFALPADSKDAVLLTGTLASGSYTAHLSAAPGTAAGPAIAELYDATSASSGDARLVNLSARAQVGGGDLLIAGFVVTGSTPKKVLITGIGPELAEPPFNLAGTMANPRLELFDGNSRLVASNDDWSFAASTRNPFLADAAAQTGALLRAVAPTSRSAALLVFLPPGNYTAQVSGSGGATGIALVEVYEVP